MTRRRLIKQMHGSNMPLRKRHQAGDLSRSDTEVEHKGTSSDIKPELHGCIYLIFVMLKSLEYRL